MVTAAESRAAGLWLTVDGYQVQATIRWWRYLSAGLVLLLDNVTTDGHFGRTYVGWYAGDPANASGPLELEGGVNDPVVTALLTRWALDEEAGRLTLGPVAVPTVEAARTYLSGLPPHPPC